MSHTYQKRAPLLCRSKSNVAASAFGSGIPKADQTTCSAPKQLAKRGWAAPEAAACVAGAACTQRVGVLEKQAIYEKPGSYIVLTLDLVAVYCFYWWPFTRW